LGSVATLFGLGCVATLKFELGWAMVTDLLFAALVTMSVVSAALAFAQEDAALKKHGELLLATNCSRCHAIGRIGASRHPDARIVALRAMQCWRF
jgi:mono/diheme cytochrome c family protein